VRFDHPSVLCRELALGELDVALVSSFEYLRRPVYSVVDGVAIASDGAVYSVVLAHPGALEDLHEVIVDPASETSVNLLRCLLGKRGCFPRFVASGALSATRGQLFIGDQAIRFREQVDERIEILDLGADWKAQTGLPFVYALWLVRPGYPDRENLAQALRAIAHANLVNLNPLLAEQPESRRAFCEFYFRDCLRFSFAKEEKQGFQEFAKQCATQKLLPSVPPPPALI
jgi:chorismate dehydratase